MLPLSTVYKTQLPVLVQLSSNAVIVVAKTRTILCKWDDVVTFVAV